MASVFPITRAAEGDGGSAVTENASAPPQMNASGLIESGFAVLPCSPTSALWLVRVSEAGAFSERAALGVSSSCRSYENLYVKKKKDFSQGFLKIYSFLVSYF